MMLDLFKIEAAKIIRNSTHNLSITEENELDNDIYFGRIRYFIEMLEGRRNEAYLDGILNPDKPAKFISAAKFYSLDQATQDELRSECIKKTGKDPITTVGVGANIESEEIRNRFDQLLRQPGLMEQIYFGKAELTDEQVDMIFADSISTRLAKLHKIYGSDWDKLRANERVAILSLYFNHQKLVNENTNFRKHIRNYVQTNDEVHLRLAVKEVVTRSNLDKSTGIQNRRNAEGTLLASNHCPTYTKPNESVHAAKIKVAKIHETIVPLHNDSSKNRVNSEYFIWRTKMDEKVRQEHVLLEGKVFRKDNPPGYLPGAMNRCRCHAEEVPDYILVDDEIVKSRAFELYLRKGIKHRLMVG